MACCLAIACQRHLTSMLRKGSICFGNGVHSAVLAGAEFYYSTVLTASPCSQLLSANSVNGLCWAGKGLWGARNAQSSCR